MSPYTEVEQPFLQPLAAQSWNVIDQGPPLPQDAAPSLRPSFRPWWLPGVFRDAVRDLNTMPHAGSEGAPWLTDRQLDELESQLFGQPQRTLLEANQAVHELLLKAHVSTRSGGACGCGCTRRAASAMKCRATTGSKSGSTTTLRPPASPRIRAVRSSGQRAPTPTR